MKSFYIVLAVAAVIMLVNVLMVKQSENASVQRYEDQKKEITLLEYVCSQPGSGCEPTLTR